MVRNVLNEDAVKDCVFRWKPLQEAAGFLFSNFGIFFFFWETKPKGQFYCRRKINDYKSPKWLEELYFQERIQSRPGAHCQIQLSWQENGHLYCLWVWHRRNHNTKNQQLKLKHFNQMTLLESGVCVVFQVC